MTMPRGGEQFEDEDIDGPLDSDDGDEDSCGKFNTSFFHLYSSPYTRRNVCREGDMKYPCFDRPFIYFISLRTLFETFDTLTCQT